MAQGATLADRQQYDKKPRNPVLDRPAVDVAGAVARDDLDRWDKARTCAAYHRGDDFRLALGLRGG